MRRSAASLIIPEPALPGPIRERAWLSLGGNIGDPRRAMANALRHIDADRMSSVLSVSSLYRTQPWGKLDQPEFLNAAAGIETERSPRALLDFILDTERAMKRVRPVERWGPRLIDIDLLLYGERLVKEIDLEVPHPRMFMRAFVLVPLAEIAPDLTIRNVLVASHLAGLETAGVTRITDDGSWWRED